MADATSSSRLRLLLLWFGVSLAVQAAAIFLLSSLFASADAITQGPVIFAPLILAQVNIRVGAAVLLSFTAIAFLALSTNPMFSTYARQLSQNRHPARWLIFSLTSSVTVFLVAQVNGITDIGTLVLMYAATSAMTLFTVLQERESRAGSSNMLPMSFGAAIGIVPWGIIAFHEIAASLVGVGPSLMVRLITLLMLASAFAFALSQWSEQRRATARNSAGNAAGKSDCAGEHIFVVLSGVSTSVFAWTVFVALS